MKQLLAASWSGAHNQVTKAGSIAWGNENLTLPEMIGRAIYVGLSLLGLVFLVYILIAGFKWMTAQGTEKQVTEAKDTIKNSIIGLVIILLSFALTTFVMTELGGAQNEVTPVATNVLTLSSMSGAKCVIINSSNFKSYI